MLLKMALAYEPDKRVAYIEYYIREQRETMNKEDIENEIKRVFKDGRVIKKDVDIEQVPKIYRWMEQAIRGGQ